MRLMQTIDNPITKELTHEMKAIIKRHPIYAFSKQVNQGEGYLFDIDIGVTFKDLKTENGVISEVFKGESIQAQFVKTTLEYVFPNAKFSSDVVADKNALGKKVVLSILDEAETNATTDINDIRTSESLEMSVLKIANGRTISRKISSEFLKENLHLEDKYLVHIYGEIDPISVLDEIRKVGSHIPDSKIVLIYSSREENPFNHKSRRPNEFYEIKISTISTISGSIEATSKPILLTNDTKGYMPTLHRASDVTIVKGPINLFEGLNAGTPTIFYTLTMREKYSPIVWRWAANLALQSNGAIEIAKSSELSNALSKAQKINRDAITPSYLLMDSGQTIFDRYLDSLLVKIN